MKTAKATKTAYATAHVNATERAALAESAQIDILRGYQYRMVDLLLSMEGATAHRLPEARLRCVITGFWRTQEGAWVVAAMSESAPGASLIVRWRVQARHILRVGVVGEAPEALAWNE